MAVNPFSPGVYIEEASLFPPSVASVSTAVPAFIGYTEKGTPLVPTRITSMLEYETIFGVAYPEPFSIQLTNTVANPTINISPLVGSSSLSEYTLHYHMRMYFANGGGPCYIVSVGLYGTSISHTALIDGINITEKADEVTLLVAPETMATTISSAQRATVHDAALALCSKMKDRFTIMDVLLNTTVSADAALFRNNEVNNSNLKYGATYYPPLDTVLTRYYDPSALTLDDDRPSNDAGPYDGKKLSELQVGLPASATLTVLATLSSATPVANVLIGTVTITGVADGNPTTSTQFEVVDDSGNPGFADVVATAQNLRDSINSNTTLALSVIATIASPGVVKITAKVPGIGGNGIIFSDPAPANVGLTLTTTTSGFLGGGVDPDKTLYNNIVSALGAYTMRLYPSATMAGIYASVDRDRGVWKAPANISLTGVIAPAVNISAADQENLNVDAGSGKSINAIRTFTGKGVLAWGARTLAGNDNEWRYISVRRLFIYAEESIQKASEFVVFEPNDRNTWSRVRSMISNFLTNLWRDGALAGATPGDAFFVRVGLGETMTAQDILEGKLIIEVGLAAVRPAEFIILRFSHKLQES